MNKQILAVLVLAMLFSSSMAQVTLPWDAKGLADDWAAFKAKFQKAYDSIATEIKSFEAWLKNRQSVHASSGVPKTWEEGETSMSDVSDEDLRLHYLNLQIPQSAKNSVRGASDASLLPAAPASVDWRTQGKVTPVKNQGGCGSCWAFATVGSLEALNLILKNPQDLYSEQYLVDCTNNVGAQCYACQGGWPSGALGWIKNNGIASANSCPYRAAFTGQTYCSSIAKSSLKTYGSGTISVGNTDELARAVAIQPVVVCIDASNWGSYRGGIFNNCNPQVHNHAVLLVGYTADAWIIKNSWGTGWGEQGFIRLARPGNTCGIADYANFPLRSAAGGVDSDKNCSGWKSYCGKNAYVDRKLFFLYLGLFLIYCDRKLQSYLRKIKMRSRT